MADENDYKTFSPDQLQKFVGCFVELTLCEAEKLEGWVFTIDPVSYSIVIAKAIKEDESRDSKPIVIVMAKAIQQLRVVETTKCQPEWLDNFATKKMHEYTNAELQTRKVRVVEWLNKNRVPIMENSEDGDRSVQVIGGLVIQPPYDVDSCRGTNEIVLERIRKLISSMPKD